MGLARNRLRTTLTALGVCVGVFALSTIVAIGDGLETAVRQELTDGENPRRLMVRPGFGPRARQETPVEGVDDPVKRDRIQKAIAMRLRGGPGQRRTRLTLDALAAIRSDSRVASIRPFASDRFRARLGEQELENALSYGVGPGDERWRRRVILGEPLSEKKAVWVHEYLLYRWGLRSDAEQARAIGQELVLSRRGASGIQAAIQAAQGAGYELPIDPKLAERFLAGFGGLGGKGLEEERVTRVPIAGVIRQRIEEDGFDVWEDRFSIQADLFFPQRFAEELYLQVPANIANGFGAVMVETKAEEQVKELEQELKGKGYAAVSTGTILERVGQISAMLTAVVSGLTGIALVVAMLGIVNTMVMNVSERTREIGVLKALGATDAQVRGLFLFESGLIGLSGGVAGIGLALLASVPGDAYVRRAIFELSHYRYPGSVFHYSPSLLAAGLLGAVGLSVIAALGPASRASRIDPVRALRDE